MHKATLRYPRAHRQSQITRKSGDHAPASVVLDLQFASQHPASSSTSGGAIAVVVSKTRKAQDGKHHCTGPCGSGARLSASSDPVNDQAYLRYQLLLANLWKSSLVETKPGMLLPKPSSWL